MFDWLRNKPAASEPAAKKAGGFFSTHAFDSNLAPFDVDSHVRGLMAKRPTIKVSGAQDDSDNGVLAAKMYYGQAGGISDALIGWYANQGFIGAQLCGILAQNWLINKACTMPGRDAVRNGYNIVSIDGDDLEPEAAKLLKRFDRRYGLNRQLREFVRKGRIFGIRIAMFKVESTDPKYYEKPFNLDGVAPNSYKGIVQVDPYWTAPMLDEAAAARPDTLHFYEPTFWIIDGKKVHRTHLVIYRHAEPVDILKPEYIYGGIPVPQMIMERVYAAERTANEAPQLAQTKRTNVWLTNMEAFMANAEQAASRLKDWAFYRDNYGVKIGDKEGDALEQFDTSLADLDAVIMTQYQLVAAASNVPATKLMGTQPKGFNSTGEYEEASYHEELESIQQNDLTPLAERHHMLVMKSVVVPKLKCDFVETTVSWNPLDTPTAKELAETNYQKAQTGQMLIESGAIMAEEERRRVATDRDSGYHEIGLDDMPDGDGDG
jgi:hypothetical protein